jgi:predicted transposase YbfD/YdcC
MRIRAGPARLVPGVQRGRSIENGLHGQRDITFADDDSRLREGHGPENAALLKRIVVSMLKNAQVGKEKWMSGKRQMAALDPKIMESVLSQFLSL